MTIYDMILIEIYLIFNAIDSFVYDLECTVLYKS